MFKIALNLFLQVQRKALGQHRSPIDPNVEYQLIFESSSGNPSQGGSIDGGVLPYQNNRNRWQDLTLESSAKKLQNKSYPGYEKTYQLIYQQIQGVYLCILRKGASVVLEVQTKNWPDLAATLLVADKSCLYLENQKSQKIFNTIATYPISEPATELVRS